MYKILLHHSLALKLIFPFFFFFFNFSRLRIAGWLCNKAVFSPILTFPLPALVQYEAYSPKLPIYLQGALDLWNSSVLLLFIFLISFYLVFLICLISFSFHLRSVAFLLNWHKKKLQYNIPKQWLAIIPNCAIEWYLSSFLFSLSPAI